MASSLVGTLLNERYRIDSELARGGIGIVYRAHDTLLKREVAVKVLSAPDLGSEARARLLREAQSVAQLNHPHIVAVHDAGETEDTPFIVMELVEGESLAERRPGTLDEILPIARQICAVLDHAHSHGIIHRDLKPENVLVTDPQPPSIKLMDFGLARSAASRLTTEGVLIGTVFYLAPEQALGKPIDHRVDLYALGVMLYELVTGELPFTADDPLAVVSQHIHAPVVPPRERDPEIPPALNDLIVCLLSKNPDERPASAAEVAGILVQIASGAGGTPLIKMSERVSRPRHNLPAPPNPFIGRVDELAHIRDILSDPDCRLLTLVGMGGMGKTRLALHAAGGVLEDYPAGVWLVALAPLEDENLVSRAAAAALGVQEQPNRPLTDTIVNALQDRRLLLVVDNCEHVLGGAARLVGALLERCPDLNVLTTSRERLGIPGERLYQVLPMSLPEVGGTPEQLALSDAVRLFRERAAAIRPDFELHSQNIVEVARLCRTLDGMPLAIELAAARLRALSVKEISVRLDDRFRLLTGGSRTALPRQGTLQATVRWSYDLLAEPERALFDQLSVFRGGFTLEAAEAICGGEGVQKDEVLDLLASLVEKSLVVVSEKPQGTTRYSLLETLRQYAGRRLRESGFLDGVLRRHAQFYAALAEEAEPHLYGPNVGSWCDRLEVEEENLRAVIHWSLGSDEGETALRMTEVFTELAFTRAYRMQHELEWIRKALTLYRGDDLGLRAKALSAAGIFSHRIDLNDEAEKYLLESIELARKVEDTHRIAFALGQVGMVNVLTGKKVLGEKRAREGLVLAREAGDMVGLRYALLALAQEAEVSEAWELMDEALQATRELGSPTLIAHTLTWIGELAMETGDLRKAQAAYEEGLLKFREVGNKVGQWRVQRWLAWNMIEKGEFSRAAELLERSRELSREAGWLEEVAYDMDGLAEAAHYRGDYETAENLCQESLDICQRENDQTGTAIALNRLGVITRDKGDYDRAQKYCEESLRLIRELNWQMGEWWIGWEGWALSSLASIAHRKGDIARSIELYQESLRAFRRDRNRLKVIRVLGGMACALASQGSYEGATRLLSLTSRQREITGLVLPVPDRPYYDRALEIVQQALDDETFAAMWDDGQSMSLEEAFTLALDEVEVGDPADNPGE